MSLSTAAQDQLQQAVVQNAAYKGYSDGTVEFYGDQIEVMTGYSKKAFNDKKVKWTEIIHADDRAMVRKTFVEALKRDKTYMRQYRVLSKSGGTVWIQEWGQIICRSGDEIDSVTGIIVDITEQKRIEAERLRIQRRAGKYLILSLDQIQYGIQIIKIKEIIGLHPITQVPGAPAYVKGVINLRGKVIPVVDLRTRFQLPEVEYGERTCIIVVEAQGSRGSMLIGTVVDAVSEVQHIRGEDIEDPPHFGAHVDIQCILGMAKGERSVIILLDIDHVLQSDELDSLKLH